MAVFEHPEGAVYWAGFLMSIGFLAPLNSVRFAVLVHR